MHNLRLTPVAANISKIYLSDRQTRFLDMPVGDPFGGAAYGLKEDPVSAVVAVVSFVVEYGAYIAAAGAILQVAGAVTGNEGLTTFGQVLGVVGLAGGIGSMMSSGATGGLANVGAEATGSVAVDAGVAGGADVISGAGGKAAADIATTGVTDTLTNVGAGEVVGNTASTFSTPIGSQAEVLSSQLADNAGSALSGEVLNAGSTAITGVQGAGEVANVGGVGINSASVPEILDAGSTSITGAGNTAANGAPSTLTNGSGPLGGKPDTGTSFFDKLMNGKNTKDILNTGTQLLGGAMSGSREDKKVSLLEQKNQREAEQAALENQILQNRLNNMNAPFQSAGQYMKANPKANPFKAGPAPVYNGVRASSGLLYSGR